MIKRTMQKNLTCLKIFVFLVMAFPVLSCDRKFYRGRIAVEQHSWQLKQIDTVYTRGKYRPSATWYNRHDRLNYIDNSSEFPYPYAIGTYISNFDRK
jgi:hypothetical protein